MKQADALRAVFCKLLWCCSIQAFCSVMQQEQGAGRENKTANALHTSFGAYMLLPYSLTSSQYRTTTPAISLPEQVFLSLF